MSQLFYGLKISKIQMSWFSMVFLDQKGVTWSYIDTMLKMNLHHFMYRSYFFWRGGGGSIEKFLNLNDSNDKAVLLWRTEDNDSRRQ